MPRRIEAEIFFQIEEVVGGTRQIENIRHGSGSSRPDYAIPRAPDTLNAIDFAVVAHGVKHRRERDFAFTDDYVVDYSGIEAFLRVAGWMCAAENDLQVRMGAFQAPCFCDGLRQFASHAADPHEPDRVFANFLVDA